MDIVFDVSLVGKLDLLDLDSAINYVVKCQNYDGGFGSVIGAESHAGQSILVLISFLLCGRIEYFGLFAFG